MPRFLLHHRHEPHECRVAVAAWSGFASPLRGRRAIATCHFRDHQIWWLVSAGSEREALEQLPWYLAVRSSVTRVRVVAIP
jgi:hypothetical protein